MAKRVI